MRAGRLLVDLKNVQIKVDEVERDEARYVENHAWPLALVQARETYEALGVFLERYEEK